MAYGSRTVTNTTAGLSANADYPAAVDVIGGSEYQLLKLGIGGEGVWVPLAFGQQSMAASLGVVLASDQTPVPVSTGSQLLQGLPSAFIASNNDLVEAGSTTTTINATAHVAKVGDVVAFQTGSVRYGTSYVSSVSTNSFTISPALPATPNTGDFFYIGRLTYVQANPTGFLHTVIQQDSQANNSLGLLKARDAAGGAADAGVLIFGIRNDNNSSLVGSTGDNIPLGINQYGAAYTCMSVAGMSSTDIAQGIAKQEDWASANLDGGVGCMAVRRDTPSTTTSTDGDWTTLTTDSSNRLWVNASGATVTADTELPAAAALADATANPTVPGVGAHMMGYNGTTWDRAQLATVEAAATYDTGINPANKGVTVNARLQQNWDSSHPDNSGAGADDLFYGQNQDPNGNVCMNVSSIRGKLVRFHNATGTSISGTNAPPIPIGSYGSATAPTAVTSGRAVQAWLDLNGRVATLADAGAFQDGAIATLGLKADAKSTATDTTAVTIMQVLKQISASVQAPPSQAVTNAGTFATQITPATSGGLTTYHLCSAASTNATVVKNSAGQLYGWYVKNNNASAAKKLCFHNASSTPTAGASIFFTIDLAAGAAANVMTEIGIPFSTGIAITTVVGGGADSDSTAVALNDLNINLFYK